MKQIFLILSLTTFLTANISGQEQVKEINYNFNNSQQIDWTVIDQTIQFGISEYIRLTETFEDQQGILVLRFIDLGLNGLRFSVSALKSETEINNYNPFSHIFMYKEHPVLVRKPVSGDNPFTVDINTNLNYQPYDETTFNSGQYLCSECEQVFKPSLIEFTGMSINIKVYNDGSIPSEYSLLNTDY